MSGARHRRRAALAIVIALALPAAAGVAADDATAASAARAPILLELFTSEGCSSCPPADALLERLVDEQPVPGARLIALSQHVDYWNGLGWRDPFSSPAFTARQRAYADLVDDGRLYTPQLVVDGRSGLVGSDRDAALAAIERATEAAKGRVALNIAPDGADRDAPTRLAISIDAVPASAEPLAVSVATVQRRTLVAVPRGENAGRRLGHVAVARALERIGTIEPGVTTFSATVPLPVPRGARRGDFDAVVFVQADPVGPIVAAGLVSLPAVAAGADGAGITD